MAISHLGRLLVAPINYKGAIICTKKSNYLIGFAGKEVEVRNFWKENDIIKKNFDMNKGGRYFTFYDGPPTANRKATCWSYLNKSNERYNS